MNLRQYFILTIFFVSGFVFSQTKSSIKYIDCKEYAQQLDSLKKVFVNIDEVPQQFELAFYTALSYYPELQNSKIKTKYTGIKTTLNIRPTLFSLLFNKRHNRQYILRINNNGRNGNIEMKDVPYQAAVGVFGHEFAHVLDYRSAGLLGIIQRSYWYIFNDSRTLFEHNIDLLTIDQGLGWQLYEWSHYVLNSNNATKEYKALKQERYLTPSEIISSMNKD